VIQSSLPPLSVVVPYLNAKATLRQCLESLLDSGYPNLEIVAVDDRSDDGSFDEIKDLPVVHVTMLGRSGAAAVRTAGVAASSHSILAFFDADVAAAKGALFMIAADFIDDPQLAAVFGEYTPHTTHDNFPTVYKNLIHHFTHEESRTEALSFWCGCGAVRREAFEAVGGFDESYAASSVEDIAFGYELTGRGYKIQLDKRLRVTHAKRYTFAGLVRSDFCDRAIPWTKLMVGKGIFHADLNLRWPHLLSAVILTLLIPLLAVLLALAPPVAGLGVLGAAVCVYLLLNMPMYLFVSREKGVWFTIEFISMHAFTYLYSVAGFVVGLIKAMTGGTRPTRQPSRDYEILEHEKTENDRTVEPSG